MLGHMYLILVVEFLESRRSVKMPETIRIAASDGSLR